jgi:phenylacetate-coenzyme A ligase PaaK-like adenylate-forming protein
MNLYGQFYRAALMPAWEQGVRKRSTLRHLRYLQETQWLSLDELLALQRASLVRLLAHAYDNVPYYRETFDRNGFRPGDVLDIADVEKLPLLTRRAAQLAGDRRRSTAAPFANLRKTTGGSTGEPLVFGYETESECWRQAIRLRGYAWAGYHPGNRSLLYWGRVSPPVKWTQRLKIGLDRGLRGDHFMDCGLRSSENLALAAEWIRRKRPTAIVAYSHAAVDLARYILTNRLRTWGTIPVICCAEELLTAERHVLSEAFGPDIFETYGCRELMLIATECGAHAGLHVSMENLVVELIVRDGDKVRAARPGETGEVAVTDLHNFGMPFIRYLTGDFAIAGLAERCPCGRALPRLASVQGRLTETLRGENGSLVEGILFNIIFTEMADVVRQFQVVQAVDRSVTIKIVPAATFQPDDVQRIRRRCSDYLGSTPVRVEEVATIPDRKNGKRQLVVVEAN